MTKASDNLFPGILIRESLDDGSEFSNPSADYRRLFVGEDGDLHLKDSSGTVTDFPAGGGSGGALANNHFVGNLSPIMAISTPTALTANRAYLYRYVPIADVTVDTANWHCTASNGNLDIGIYNSDLSSLLGSTGSFASPGTGARSQALSGSVAMTAGSVYYLAFAASSTTLRVAQLTSPAAYASGWNIYGREESALPLPAGPVTADAWEDHTVHPAFWFTT